MGGKCHFSQQFVPSNYSSTSTLGDYVARFYRSCDTLHNKANNIHHFWQMTNDQRQTRLK